MTSSLRSFSSNSTLSLDFDSRPTTPGDFDQEDDNFGQQESEHSGLCDYVMVVGGLGYIGSHTTLELLIGGYNVIVVDDLSNSYVDVVERITSLARRHLRSDGKKMPSLRVETIDYRSPAMRRLFEVYRASGASISAVIHFAAFKSVSESIQSPLAYYRNNVCGLVDLLFLVEEFGIKNFVFSSSATVYGAKSNLGKPLEEDDLVHFDEIDREAVRLNGALGVTCPYGRTKLFAESILADMAKANTDMRITALRYFNPVGCHPSGLLAENPRQTPTNLFPVVASVVQGKRAHLDVFGTDWDSRDGTAVRDFIHVVDLAQGHLAALRAASSPQRQDAFRAYNLGTGNGMTVAEIITSFEAVSQRKVPTVRAPRREGDVGACVAAVSRAEGELGWRATRTVVDCARDYWNSLFSPRGTMANKSSP